ncbi:transmembrane protein 62 [Cephus cinctus]|uniref:Transmembrane protein 62 n=1 Tax=Cephus cinctus TaxID=211228 RepID=A0AAJ7BHS8_CEPCN|nr:transmembrane protein 62 [Cephus cinctus]
MRISKSTVVFLISILMLSVFVANVTNLINVDSHAISESQLYEGLDNSEPRWAQPKKYEIGESFDYLMWFLQISDLHISIFREPSRITELKEFCDITVGAIKPSVVIASGDLTDAIERDRMGSRQVKEEWIQYKKVLDDVNISQKTIWLDIRGNHDNFNVPNLQSKENYYVNYSIQGKRHSRSYMHEITVGSEKYSFIGMDACLEPGPRRPFNFVGVLDGKETETLHELVRESKGRNNDYIIWFGHYPTSCILAQCDGGVRSIMGRYRESMVYLCGHYHMLGGAVPNMYTLQQAGFLELELADWKENRMYRLAVIDHGQFSFTDIKHRDWPVVLITNPKHSLYAMPRKENLQSITDSTHIRVVAFSIAPIKSVKVQINDEEWLNCNYIKGPLYTAKWNPLNYLNGIHHITVHVVDEDDRELVTSQPFSLDGTRLSFRVLPRLILMSNASHIFQFFFGSMLLLLIVPLCVFRILHKLCEGKHIRRPRIPISIIHWWVRKLWILSSIDRLFFPVILYALYLTIGPWVIGEIIDNHTGMIFAWGIFVGNSYLPGSLTYAYGFFQLFSFHLPLVLILAHRVDQRLQIIEKPARKPISFLRILWRHIPFLILITMQISMAYSFWLAYGTLATILGALRTWSIVLAIFLWYQANAMPQSCMRSAVIIWSSSGLRSTPEDDVLSGADSTK